MAKQLYVIFSADSVLPLYDRLTYAPGWMFFGMCTSYVKLLVVASTSLAHTPFSKASCWIYSHAVSFFSPSHDEERYLEPRAPGVALVRRAVIGRAFSHVVEDGTIVTCLSNAASLGMIMAYGEEDLPARCSTSWKPSRPPRPRPGWGREASGSCRCCK